MSLFASSKGGFNGNRRNPSGSATDTFSFLTVCSFVCCCFLFAWGRGGGGGGGGGGGCQNRIASTPHLLLELEHSLL